MKRFTSRTFIAFALLSGTAVVSMDMAVAAETTQASWYGPGFHGRKTASGETFNQNAMTAAHKTRRLGSTVKVTNVATGKSVVVKINDRGPFIKGRGIDLSKAAARAIGIDGVGRVRIVDI